jgi:hypothetical protein
VEAENRAELIEPLDLAVLRPRQVGDREMLNCYSTGRPVGSKIGSKWRAVGRVSWLVSCAGSTKE